MKVEESVDERWIGIVVVGIKTDTFPTFIELSLVSDTDQQFTYSEMRQVHSAGKPRGRAPTSLAVRIGGDRSENASRERDICH